ncbi:MAG: beta-propeller fold lactonase family protein [Chthoniobacterales bacterium]|nr:beta-propeller fold lactonase family protein [Chthoniobacterales bacterium]
MDGSVAGNGVTGFRVGNDGTLTPIPDSFRALSSPIAVPGVVTFSPNGSSHIVTGKVANFIDVFQVRENGLLSMPKHNRAAPDGRRTFAATFRDDGRLLTVESGLPVLNNAGVSSYDLDRATQSLSVITNSAKNRQTDSCWIVITDDQQYAYTANFSSGTISSYRLGTGGRAALIDKADFFMGGKSEPTDLAFSSGSRYLYNLLRGTGGVAAFEVQQDGTLKSLGVFGVGQALPIADGASGLAAY